MFTAWKVTHTLVSLSGCFFRHSLIFCVSGLMSWATEALVGPPNGPLYTSRLLWWKPPDSSPRECSRTCQNNIINFMVKGLWPPCSLCTQPIRAESEQTGHFRHTYRWLRESPRDAQRATFCPKPRLKSGTHILETPGTTAPHTKWARIRLEAPSWHKIPFKISRDWLISLTPWNVEQYITQEQAQHVLNEQPV